MRSKKEDDEAPLERILILSADDSIIDPPIDRGGTSSTNYTATEQNVRRSLLIDNQSIKRSTSSTYHQQQKKNKVYHTCHQIMLKFKKFVETRMAFQPPVPDDPRLFSKNKKRIILACLAAGSSLNGFCSTVYVCFKKKITFVSLINYVYFNHSFLVFRIFV